MATVFFDDFRAYPTPADMISNAGLGGPYTSGNSNWSFYSPAFVQIPSLAPGRPNEIGFDFGGNSSDLYSFTTKFAQSPMQDFCFSFLIGGKAANSAPNMMVIFGNEGLSDLSLSTLPGVAIVVNGSSFTVSYRIRNSTTSTTVNQLELATGPTLKVGEAYHINGKISHTAAQARLILYINGVKYIDVTYDRDRIDNGLQSMAFDRVTLGGVSSSATLRSTYRNLTFYSEDANTPFPSRPFRADDLEPTAGQGYDALRMVNGQANDASAVTINPGGQLVGTFDDLPTDGGEVKALYVRSRHFGSGGLAPSELDIEIRNAAGQVVRSVNSVVASGVGGVSKKAIVPVTTKADIDGLTFRLSARS
ncbi:hypothetical protein TW83_10030 [Paracoccus sp. S4493]|uniref:hypothetical protein n=1 Tax=Paracoccus sp. S4493 TaxID=579490 RepID=UPI0005FA1727|nr:hypothetical protein [Paracoccus sp. S4493]KJZ31251.1 hypothetical protein TW83_10030 [Paracoccus sp. S4493]